MPFYAISCTQAFLGFVHSSPSNIGEVIIVVDLAAVRCKGLCVAEKRPAATTSENWKMGISARQGGLISDPDRTQ